MATTRLISAESLLYFDWQQSTLNSGYVTTLSRDYLIPGLQPWFNGMRENDVSIRPVRMLRLLICLIRCECCTVFVSPGGSLISL